MQPHRQIWWISVIIAAILGSRATGIPQVFPPDTLVLTEADGGTTVTSVVGQAITVNLRGNLSTGYAWELASVAGDSVRTNGAMTYLLDGGGGVGVGGTFCFPFIASNLGDTALLLEYRRWGEPMPIQSFAVQIHVTAGPPKLFIRREGTSVALWWPIAGSTNYFLEGTSSLDAPRWAALNVLPLPEGTNYTVRLGTTDRALYFRLRRL